MCWIGTCTEAMMKVADFADRKSLSMINMTTEHVLYKVPFEED